MTPPSSPRPLNVAFAVIESDTSSNEGENENENGNVNGNMPIIDSADSDSDSDSEGTFDDMPPLIDRNHRDSDDSDSDNDSEYDDIPPLIDGEREGHENDAEGSMGNGGYAYEDDGDSMEDFNDSSSVSIQYFDGSDNSDDDDDGDDGHEMPREMYQFFHMIAQMENAHTDSDSDEPNNPYHGSDDEDYNPYEDDEEDDEGDDDDDSDSGPCTCPNCLMDRIIGRRDCWDEDSIGECHPCADDGNDNGEDNEGERPLIPDASPCAICMEPETAKRRFVHLPCCSPTEMERDPISGIPVDTSSTRFCQKCLARTLVTSGCAVPCHPSSTPTSRVGAQLAGECPRCKKLLVLEEFIPTEFHTSSANSPMSAAKMNLYQSLPIYKRTRAATPSTEALFWYVARSIKGNGRTADAQYRAYLLTLTACPNPNFIPEEVLLNIWGRSDKIRDLCQWGLLSRRKTTKQWLRKLWVVKILLRVFHAVLDLLWRRNKLLNRLWEGPMVQYVSSIIYNWKISKVLRSASELIQQLPNRAGTVYYMDPLVQSQLRSLVLRHLKCSVDVDGLDHDYYCHHVDYDHEEECAIRLLPPMLRTPSEKEKEEIEAFCERNGRRQCFLGAWNSFSSAWMAICRFRLFRSLRLLNHGLSLALLSTRYLGLPHMAKWPAPVAPSSDGTTKGMMHSPIVVSIRNTRWRWHLLSGLNVALMVLALNIMVQLVFVGMNLILAASLCLIVGKLMETSTSEKDAWLETKRILAVIVVSLYAAWNSSSLLYATIEMVRQQAHL